VVGTAPPTVSTVRDGMAFMVRVGSARPGLRVSHGFDRHCSIMRLTTFDWGVPCATARTRRCGEPLFLDADGGLDQAGFWFRFLLVAQCVVEHSSSKRGFTISRSVRLCQQQCFAVPGVSPAVVFRSECRCEKVLIHAHRGPKWGDAGHLRGFTVALARASDAGTYGTPAVPSQSGTCRRAAGPWPLFRDGNGDQVRRLAGGELRCRTGEGGR
jgi:hypothetical protein